MQFEHSDDDICQQRSRWIRNFGACDLEWLARGRSCISLFRLDNGSLHSHFTVLTTRSWNLKIFNCKRNSQGNFRNNFQIFEAI